MGEFYANVFDMDIVLRSEDGAGGVSVFDGYLILALPPLTLEGSGSVALDHFGFQVDNTDAILGKLMAAGMRAASMRPFNRPYAENRGMDPEANLFDFSELGFQRSEYRTKREAKKNDTIDTWVSYQWC